MLCKMRKTLDSRLKAVEQKAAAVSKFSPVHAAIRNRAFYDELPEDLRALYCEYCGVDRTTLESVTLTVLCDLHFILREFEKPTPEELQEIIAEVQAMVEGGSQ